MKTYNNIYNSPDIDHQDHPAISVVMPTFNDGEYLRGAIDSILNQTFHDFEFIIVNDGSTDDTLSIIASYKDDRIRYLKNGTNLGNAVSRNIGMKAAIGKYIAIMDSDDISAPKRFELQYEYLEKHPEIGILGSPIIFFDADSWFYRYYPTDPDYIKAFLFFKNPMAQNAVMLRRGIIEAHQLLYNPEHENGEDFDFWYRAALKDVRIANLKNVLIYYRQSEGQLSHPLNAVGRVEKLKSYFKEKLLMLGIKFGEDEFILLHNFIRGRIDITIERYQLIDRSLKIILLVNKQKKIFNISAFRAVIFAHRLRLIKYAYFEKGNLPGFTKKALSLMADTGLASMWLFWRNEGKFGKNFGTDNVYTSPLALPF